MIVYLCCSNVSANVPFVVPEEVDGASVGVSDDVIVTELVIPNIVLVALFLILKVYVPGGKLGIVLVVSDTFNANVLLQVPPLVGTQLIL